MSSNLGKEFLEYIVVVFLKPEKLRELGYEES